MPRRAVPLERRNVLYLEDHPVNVTLMEVLFDRLPHLELHVATSCAEALRRASGLNPVLLLLDINLPDGRGDALLPWLRRIDGCADAPAVAVTSEDDFVLDGSGFTELWTKPLDLPRVLQRLRELSARHDPSPLWTPREPAFARAYPLPVLDATLGAMPATSIHATGA